MSDSTLQRRADSIRQQMSRVIGAVEDFDGRRMAIGVDYDTVTVGQYCRFTAAQFEELSHLLVQAAWQAAANSERMRQEASDEETEKVLAGLRERLAGDA